MAADLRRFLDDKPIAARRVGLGERLWRWCVRRPALARLAAALLLSLAVGMGGICWQWVRAETNFKEATRHRGSRKTCWAWPSQEQRRAEQNLEEAARQRTIAEQEAERAEANYQTARKAVNELLTMVSEDDLMNPTWDAAAATEAADAGAGVLRGDAGGPGPGPARAARPGPGLFPPGQS